MAGIITGNGEVIAAPSPGVLRYGLFSAATVTEDLDARGIASGFQLPAEGCGTIRAYDANCDTHPAKTFDEGLSYMEATPYWIYATRKCGTVGTTAQDIASSVRNRLLSLEQTQVERQFWGGGTVAADPNLTGVAGVSTVTLGAGVTGFGAAIAALEDAFYETYGYVGVIHVSMAAYGAAAYSELIERQGGTLRTPLGSAWAFGAGYGVTGPAGAAPAAGSVWAFMTPPVLIRRSTVMVPDVTMTMDRSLNQWMGLAERVYAHTWLCDSVFAVQVPLSAPKVDTEAA
jgi:hypothetical protein